MLHSAEPADFAVPFVNHSFYCNEVYGERYWDYVSEELPQVMHRFLRLSDDPDVNNVMRYLREREIVHYQRFGEAFRTG